MFQRNSQGFYEFTELTSLELINGVSTRQYGNMAYKFGDKKTVASNRQKFLRDVGINDVAQMGLVLGTQVAIVNEPKTCEGVDGLITNKTGLGLMVLTGDCAPIIFFDPRRKVLALAHCGWKGTVGKLPTIMVAKMLSGGCNIVDIIIAIGPSIERCCYVEPGDPIQKSLPEWENFLTKEDEGFRYDLNGFTVNELLKIGVSKNNIFWPNFCTRDHQNEFFCSQLETAGLEQPGRFATVVQMT